MFYITYFSFNHKQVNTVCPPVTSQCSEKYFLPIKMIFVYQEPIPACYFELLYTNIAFINTHFCVLARNKKLCIELKLRNLV